MPKATYGAELTYYPDERIYIDGSIQDKYPLKCWNIYEEDGVGLVAYIVLQCDTPKKSIATKIFKYNPQIRKVYQALRDWVSYDLIEDLKCSRHVEVYINEN